MVESTAETLTGAYPSTPEGGVKDCDEVDGVMDKEFTTAGSLFSNTGIVLALSVPIISLAIMFSSYHILKVTAVAISQEASVPSVFKNSPAWPV